MGPSRSPGPRSSSRRTGRSAGRSGGSSSSRPSGRSFSPTSSGSARSIGSGRRARRSPRTCSPSLRPRSRSCSCPRRSDCSSWQAGADRGRDPRRPRTGWGSGTWRVSRPMRDNARVRDDLDEGRRAYARRAWRDAHDAFSRADEATPLDADDLELLGTAAYMLGRDDGLGRVPGAVAPGPSRGGRPAARRPVRALGGHASRAPAGRWGRPAAAGRAQRILERVDGEVAEHGYLLAPARIPARGGGRPRGCRSDRGPRRRDRRAVRRRRPLRARHAPAGTVPRHPERLSSTASGSWTRRWSRSPRARPSPIVTGLVYCGVILACVETFRRPACPGVDRRPHAVVRRAARPRRLHRPVPVHRAELLQLRGAWPDALEPGSRRGGAARPRASTARPRRRRSTGSEAHRLRGELDAAETADRESSRFGWEPQPGLALLRLAQGKQPGGHGGDAPGARARRRSGRSVPPLLPGVRGDRARGG